MAALAVLGRIAFAALPNVKPSTDIILVSGYALGGAPGFVVGALTGLVSNFFFGQGPWTVWQMGAWGLTGLLGAGLAAVTRGRVGRWPLAIVCMVVGFAFAAFQDVGDWVTYSDHSLAQLGVYVGKGTGFDTVHAAGCLVFALVFGPALMHALRRFTRACRSRGSHSTALPCPWPRSSPPGRSASPARRPPARRPPRPLTCSPPRTVTAAIGAAPGAGSSQLFAGWAALGLAAEGVNPADVSQGGASLLDYIGAGAAGHVGLRLAGAHDSRRPGGGRQPVGVRRAQPGRRARDASRARRLGLRTGELTAFAVLALRAAGAPAGSRTTGWLADQQDADGGFGFGPAGGASDVDDTGAVLEALAGTAPARVIGRAVAFVRGAQNGDGGLPSESGGPSDAQSTAWAVQGLLAAGTDPNGVRRGGASPLDYLAVLIASDGHVRYSQTSDQTPVWVTAQAAMALAGRAAAPRPGHGLSGTRRATRSQPHHCGPGDPRGSGQIGLDRRRAWEWPWHGRRGRRLAVDAGPDRPGR